MSSEKFNWKGLFINEEEEESKSKKTPSKPDAPAKEFPKDDKPVSKFPDQPPVKIHTDKTTLNKIVEMYESGFDSLNKPGYDFYEFFKAIKAVNSNDPQLYKMALSMAQGVDKNVTKSSLLSESEYYIAEIEKVYQQYESQGNVKKNQIQESLKTKKKNLSSEISSLEKKLLEIQNQISVKKNDLHSVDASMITEVADIDKKLVANDAARNKILETITTVAEGIKNNL